MGEETADGGPQTAVELLSTIVRATCGPPSAVSSLSAVSLLTESLRYS
jgi:hypothetical protein